jgi:sugar phosphate isomerase/epimerase
VHLHDAPLWDRRGELGYGLDHQPLGAGDLDIGRLLDWLKEAAYTGPVIFELTVAQALASLEVIRELRPGVLGTARAGGEAREVR